MRNLKKALALVLALMMALSLMSFASASDYPDDSAIEQDEAVSVMSALGVFNGTDGGVFDPEGTLTRAQAAKIITYMLLDKEVADSLPNTGSKFTDCPDGRWYVGAVNFLTDMGIVAGRSETTFDPNGKVNGYEFAKMLLGALGYDSKIEKFESDSGWALNIATTARRAGLGEDLPVSAISSVYLTREQAAKLAFNTLTADMVYYQGGVSVGDVTVNPTRANVSNSTSNDYRTVAGQDGVMQFCEQYFSALKYDSSYAISDDFGHTPAGRWVNGDAPAYVNLADPTLVLTDKVADGAALAKLLPKGVPTSNTITITGNGNNDTASSGSKSLDQIAALTAPGKKVEIYVNSSNAITSVITTTYTVETIDNITEKNGVTTYDFSVTPNKTNSEDATNVIVAGTVAKGDVVTTVTANSKTYVYPTNEFTGSQTAKRTSGDVTTVTIGGAQYVVASGVKDEAAAYVAGDDFGNSADEAKYYADVNGYLVKTVSTKEAPAPEYTVIVATVAGQSQATLDNPTGYTVNVRAVLADGTIEDRTLATTQNPANPKGGTDTDPYTSGVGTWGDLICGNLVVQAANTSTDKIANLDDVSTNLEGKLFGYTLNDDGKMVLSAVTDTPANTNNMTANSKYQAAVSSYSGANNISVNTNKTVLFTKDTVFVLYNNASGKWTVEEPKTGTANLSVSSANGIAVINATGNTTATASLVFLNASTVAQTTDEYVYIDASEYSTILKDGKSTDAWEGIAPDGTKVEVYGTHGAGHIEKDGLYTYDTDKKLNETPKAATDTSDTTISSSDVYANITTGASVTDSLLHITGSTYVNITDDTQIVYVDPALEEGGVNGKNILVVMKASTGTPTEVAAIYVYGTPDTRADVPGSFGTVNKTNVTAADDPKGQATSAYTGSFTGGATAADFTFAVKGQLPDGISNVTFDATTGEATITATKDVTAATVNVTITPKSSNSADTNYKPTDKTITVTITGTWA